MNYQNESILILDIRKGGGPKRIFKILFKDIEYITSILDSRYATGKTLKEFMAGKTKISIEYIDLKVTNFIIRDDISLIEQGIDGNLKIIYGSKKFWRN